ncbi:tetratricopeptide repeat protein [Aminobacter sp. J44]|uniref:tetratricopeptide repeat protein n=1 Tax=Aminobacter sp. J44 TaxID=935262 RepID=UPI00119B0310|nr:tetratricopeptide repeat protein [Aminobacter sp. J44]TWG49811.1 tetratricopeptide repeat protein [Aminobacter sp. J44]
MKLAALFVTLLAAGTVAANANPTVERMFQTANAAAQSGQYDVAITTYRHLLREVPTPRIKLELARLLLQTGENSEALALFREVHDAKDTPQAVRRNILSSWRPRNSVPFVSGTA